MQESPHLLGSPHTLCVLTQLIRAAPFKAGPTGLGPPPFVFFYHKVGPTGLNAEVEFFFGFAQRNGASRNTARKFDSDPVALSSSTSSICKLLFLQQRRTSGMDPAHVKVP